MGCLILDSLHVLRLETQRFADTFCGSEPCPWKGSDSAPRPGDLQCLLGSLGKGLGAFTFSRRFGDVLWLQVGRGGCQEQITPPWPSLPTPQSGSCGEELWPLLEKPGSPVDPSSPPGPASCLPAPWAVTLCPVKAEEGEVSHERCPRGPGQRQAPSGRCQVVSIKAVLGGWAGGWLRGGSVNCNGPSACRSSPSCLRPPAVSQTLA